MAGGRLVAVLALSGIVAGALAATSYALVLSLPRQPWVLMAADSYAHYGTLIVGLIATAGMVELGAQTLPRAARVIEADIAASDEPNAE